MDSFWDAAGDPRDQGYRTVFDELFVRGEAAVLDSAHQCDVPPVPGGRWGMSVVFLPDAAVALRLHSLAAEALTIAGGGHWGTGFRGSSHITVRAIEFHRPQIPPGDELAGRCAAALRSAAGSLQESIRLDLRGVTLTPSGVMACAYPVDATADVFSTRLRDELGPDGELEESLGYVRNIWYLSLIHFAGPVSNPDRLVNWVRRRRDLLLGQVCVSRAELVTFGYEDRPVTRSLASVPLASRGDGARLYGAVPAAVGRLR